MKKLDLKIEAIKREIDALSDDNFINSEYATPRSIKEKEVLWNKRRQLTNKLIVLQSDRRNKLRGK